MKVLTFVDGRLETLNLQEFDSEGPQMEDPNGDGTVELVGKDNSFDYATPNPMRRRRFSA
jgi:hypothetical protein